jgi:hypothetical protein
MEWPLLQGVRLGVTQLIWSQKYDVDFESQNPNGDMHVEIAYKCSFLLSFLKHTLCT